jgi:hypothetical protein
MDRIVIKLLEHPDNKDVKMLYVGSTVYATPRVAKDGKIVTGLDENALSIITMEDGKAKKELQAKIKKDREELEKLLGRNLDPNSDFWNDFYIPLSNSDAELELDPTNPMDRLKERYLVANFYVAPSREDIENNEDYHNAIFYLHREKDETTKTVKVQKDKDKARGKLAILAEDSPNKLMTVASYIFGYSFEGESDDAYKKLSEYLEDADPRKQKKNIQNFLDVVSKDQDELSIKLILDKAIKKRVISFKGNIYRRGDVIFGNSYDEALEYLSSAENSGELVSLKKEVDKLK